MRDVLCLHRSLSTPTAIAIAALLATATPTHAIVWTGQHSSSPDFFASELVGGVLPPRYTNWASAPAAPPLGLPLEFGDGFAGGGFSSGVPEVSANWSAPSLDIDHTGGQTLMTTTGGGLLLSNGTLTRQSTSTGVHTIAAPILLGADADWDIAGDNRLDIDAAISGSFDLTKTGSAILRFEGASPNTYTGTTTVSEGKLTLAKTAGTVAVPADLTIDGTGFVQHPSGNGEQIANSATVTVDAAGARYDLNQPTNTETVNTFTTNAGLTELGGGTLKTTTYNANGGTTTLQGGTLDTNTFNANGGTINLGGGTLDTITLLGNTNINMGTDGSIIANTGAYSGNFSGSGNTTLTKNGGGTLTLPGTNVLASIEINNGNLNIASGGTLEADTGDIVMTGGTLTRDSISTITIPSGQTLDTTAGGSLDYTGSTSIATGITYDLGTGMFRHEGTLTLDGGTVTHTGWLNGVGEDGTGNNGSDLIINSGSFTNSNAISLTGGDGGSGAGINDGGDSGSITVNAGSFSASTNFVMRGGSPTTFSGVGGVGGVGGSGGNFTVNGGTATLASSVFVELHGQDGSNSSAASIDGGAGGDGGNITVTGGTLTINVTASDGLYMAGGTGGTSSGGGAAGADGQDGSVSVSGGTLHLEAGLFTNASTPPTFTDPIAFHNIPLNVSGTGIARVHDDMTIDKADVTLTTGSLLNANGVSGNDANATPGNTITITGGSAHLDAQAGSTIRIRGGNMNTDEQAGKDGGTIAVNGGSFTLNATAILDLRGGTAGDNGGDGGHAGTIDVAGGTTNLGGTVNLSGRNGKERTSLMGSGGNGGNGGTIDVSGGTATVTNTIDMTGGDGAEDNGGVNPEVGGSGGDGGNVNISGGNLVLNTGALIDMTPGLGFPDANPGPDGTPGSIAISGSGKLTLNAGIITSDNASPTPTDPIYIENTTIGLTTGGTLRIQDNATVDNAAIDVDASTVTFNFSPAAPAEDGHTLTLQNGADLSATNAATIDFDGGERTSGGRTGDGGIVNLDGGTILISGNSTMNLRAGDVGDIHDSGKGGQLNISAGTADLDGTVRLNGRNALGTVAPNDGGHAGQVTVSGTGILNQAGSGVLEIRAGRGSAVSMTIKGNTGNPGFFKVDGGTADLAGTLNLSGENGFNNIGPTRGSSSGSLIVLGGSATISGTANMTGGDGGKSTSGSPQNGGRGGDGGLVDIQGGTLTLDGASAQIDLTPGAGGDKSSSGSSNPGNPGTPGSVSITGGKLQLIQGTITTDNTAIAPGDTIDVIETDITATGPGSIRIHDDTTFQGGTVTLNSADLNADGLSPLPATPGNNITLDGGATIDALGTSNVTLIGKADVVSSKIGGNLTVTNGSFNLGPTATLSTLSGVPVTSETTKFPGSASFAAGNSSLQGTLTMHGRDGVDAQETAPFAATNSRAGANGASFTVSGTADVSLTGTLSLYGGDGGDGIQIDAIGGTGKRGTDAKGGGDGGAIDIQGGVFAVDGATTDLTGGAGGNGPDGTLGEFGGAGGNGGDGGMLFVSGGIVTIQGASTLDLSAGSAMAGGNSSGFSGIGGTGGNGGNGGQLNISGGAVSILGASTIDLSRTIGMPGGTGIPVRGANGNLGAVNLSGGTLDLNAATLTGDTTVTPTTDPVNIIGILVAVTDTGELNLNDDTTLDAATLTRDATGAVDLAADKFLTAQNSATIHYTGDTTIPVARTYALTTASTFNHDGNLTLDDAALTLDAATLNASGGTGTDAETTPGRTLTLVNPESYLNAQNASHINLAGGNVTSGGTGKNGGSIVMNPGELIIDATSTLDLSGGTGPDNGGHGGNGGSITIETGLLTLAGTVDLSGPDGNNLTSGSEFLGGGFGGNGGTLTFNGGTSTISNTLDMTGGHGGTDKQNPAEPDTGGDGGHGGNIHLNGGSLTLNAGASIDLTPGLGAIAMGLEGFEIDGQDGTPGAINVAGGTLTLNAGLVTADNTLTPVGDTTEFNALVINLSVGAIGGSATITGLRHGAVLDITGGSATFDTLNMSGEGTAITGSGGTLAVNNRLNATADAAGGLTIDHPISGPGTIIKEGTEQFLLNAANPFTGIIAANNGVIVLGDSHALQNALVAINIDNGVDINGLDPTFGSLSNSGNLSIGAQTLTTGGDNRTTFYLGILSGTGGNLIKNGTGIMTFEGDEPNTYSGLTTVNDGELHLNRNSSGCSLALTASDAACAVAPGVDAIGGNLVINGGTVLLLDNEQIPDTATVTMSGGVFDLNDLTETVNGVSGAAGVIDLKGGTLNTLTLHGSTPIQNIGLLTVQEGTYSGVLSNTIGLGQLIKNGTNTLTLDGLSPNTHTGLTTVNAGTLQLAKGTISSGGCLIADAACAAVGTDAIGGDLLINGGTVFLLAPNQIPNTAVVTVKAGADLHLSGHNETIGTLNGEATADFRLGGTTNTATIHEGAFYGNVFGIGHIKKETPGILIFGGTTSSGGQATFTVNGGTLHLDNANLQSTSDTVTINAGATLSGTADIASGVFINDGATFDPGNSPGIVNIGLPLLLAPTATLTIEVADAASPVPGTDNDWVNVTGNVTLGGTLELSTLPDPTTFAAGVPLGTEFTVLTYGTRTADSMFDTITGTLINSSLALAPLFTDTDMDMADDALILEALVPGDIDGNLAVNVSDLAVFALNFGTTPGLYDEVAKKNSWRFGDFNADGAVTVADLSLLALNFGFSAALGTDPIGLSLTDAAVLGGIDLAAVPEPNTLAIITPASFLLIEKRN